MIQKVSVIWKQNQSINQLINPSIDQSINSISFNDIFRLICKKSVLSLDGNLFIKVLN